MEYAFQLGRERPLARAEIAAVRPDLAPGRLIGDRLLVTSAYQLPVDQIQERLGGTISIAEVQKIVNQPVTDNQLLTACGQIFAALPGRNIGLSFVGPEFSPERRRALGLAIKRQLASLGIKRRLVASHEAELSSVVVRDQLRPPNGNELVIVADRDQLLIARTLASQDYQNWSDRDYGRPARDARRGMLPPKLARIMINLAGAPRAATILDPFCGVGTVLMEASLVGYRNLIGSDRDPKAIEATRLNWTWLRQNEGVAAVPTFFVSPIEQLSDKIHEPADVIVTEADLGPANLARRSPNDRLAAMNELEKRYRAWLESLRELVKSGGTVILAYPELRQPAAKLDLPAAATQLGWAVAGDPLSYARPDQLIGRQIIHLQRKTRP